MEDSRVTTRTNDTIVSHPVQEVPKLEIIYCNGIRYILYK